MLREMPLAALLPIRDACPLYYPQKSAEPAPTKRLRALLGTEAVFGAAVAATALLAALFICEPLVAACTYAIFALLGGRVLERTERLRPETRDRSTRLSELTPNSDECMRADRATSGSRIMKQRMERRLQPRR